MVITDPIARCLADCGGQKDLYKPDYSRSTDNIVVLEVWECAEDGRYQLKSCQRDAASFQINREDARSPDRRLLSQLVCIPLLTQNSKYYFDLKRDHFERLVELTGLGEVRRLAQTSPTTYDFLPQYHDDRLIGLQYSAFVSNWVGCFFGHKVHCLPSNGIIWIKEEIMDDLKQALEAAVDLANHPFYLLLALSITLISYVDRGLSQLHPRIGAVEQRSGHMPWLINIYPFLDGDLPLLSARMSGFGGQLASHKRFNLLAFEMLTTIDDFMSSDEGQSYASLSKAQAKRSAIESAKLRRRLRIQSIQIDYANTRIEKQLTALFNLITKADTNLSLRVAQSSRTIADATKRDSTSMKILAAVTVFFLPATFIASLFSTSMFDWHVPDGKTVSSQIWIYWATVAPLTMAVIGACYYLSRRWKSSAQWQDELAAQDVSGYDLGSTSGRKHDVELALAEGSVSNSRIRHPHDYILQCLHA